MGRICLLLTLAGLGGCARQGPTRYDAASERLDQGRASIFAPLGATTSTLNRQDLLDRPGGDNQTLAGALARLPGSRPGLTAMWAYGANRLQAASFSIEAVLHHPSYWWLLTYRTLRRLRYSITLILGGANAMAAATQLVECRLDEAARRCERDGARLTELRRWVLRCILGADGLVTAYQLVARLTEAGRHPAPPTIYRAIEFLLTRRLICRVECLNAFIGRADLDRHGDPVLLICRTCGSVTETDGQEVADALDRVAAAHRFAKLEATIEVEGTCPGCRLESHNLR